MRVLIITDQMPYPPITGGRVRVFNILSRLAARHEVWLVSLAETPEEADGAEKLREFCSGVEVVIREHKSPIAHLPGLARFAMEGKPLELKFEYSEEMARRIRELALARRFDIVQFEPSTMAVYMDDLPAGEHPRRVQVFHDISFDQYDRIARLSGGRMPQPRPWLHSRMMRRWEPRVAEMMDCCVTVSEQDRTLLESANDRIRVEVIPNGVDTRLYQPLPEPENPMSVLFVGKMSYLPGADGAVYFAREVLPILRDRVGQVELWIVGADPPSEVMALGEDPDIHVTGRVESVVPYYRRSAVSVVPLRAGSGTRLKVLESMAMGRPVVSTSLGCEGLDVQDAEQLLVGDSPADFAEKTARLLSDRTLYRDIADNARRFVVSRYDWDSLAGRLMDLYSRLLDPSASAGPSARRSSGVTASPERLSA